MGYHFLVPKIGPGSRAGRGLSVLYFSGPLVPWSLGPFFFGPPEKEVYIPACGGLQWLAVVPVECLKGYVYGKITASMQLGKTSTTQEYDLCSDKAPYKRTISLRNTQSPARFS